MKNFSFFFFLFCFNESKNFGKNVLFHFKNSFLQQPNCYHSVLLQQFPFFQNFIFFLDFYLFFFALFLWTFSILFFTNIISYKKSFFSNSTYNYELLVILDAIFAFEENVALYRWCTGKALKL